MSRRFTWAHALAGILSIGIACGAYAVAKVKERVVQVTAQKFHYTPSDIGLKRGEPVVLEFKSIDFVHGFKVPDLNIRADLPPGQVTRIHLTPEKAGTYDFLCDNFCGSGHEEMSGRIIVTD